MHEYAWAANPAKVERAVKELKDKKQEVTEAAVKAIYVRLLGKVLEEKEVEAVGLEKMKKDELIALAESKGIEHDGLTKDELIEALR